MQKPSIGQIIKVSVNEKWEDQTRQYKGMYGVVLETSKHQTMSIRPVKVALIKQENFMIVNLFPHVLQITNPKRLPHRTLELLKEAYPEYVEVGELRKAVFKE